MEKKYRNKLLIVLFFALVLVSGIIVFLSLGDLKKESPFVQRKSNTMVDFRLADFYDSVIKDQHKLEVDSSNFDQKVQIINGTFLNNSHRNYYGEGVPSELNVLWKHKLGGGQTSIKGELVDWMGAGWTGQPLLIQELDELFIIQGAYDHNLKKINAANGELVWQYNFGDVIKGTGTIWRNYEKVGEEDELVILQGARRGIDKTTGSAHVPSYRAISYGSGKDLWKMDQKRTKSYSRDVDGSALILNDRGYIGLENGIFTVFDPNPKYGQDIDGMFQPKIYDEDFLYTDEDKSAHGGNLVTESSPVELNGRVYITSGSGHVWGYNLQTGQIDWDFYIGSDLDGSPVVTYDECLLISVEKQYIDGQGGVFKLDPSKAPEESVVWYFPTEDHSFNSWEGGVIGTVGINDQYVDESDRHIAAIQSINGELYIVEHDKFEDQEVVLGPRKENSYQKPKLLFQENIGESISTPLVTDKRIVTSGYKGIRIYGYNARMDFKLLDKRGMVIEATPFVWQNKIYIAAKDGYLYSLGN